MFLILNPATIAEFSAIILNSVVATGEENPDAQLDPKADPSLAAIQGDPTLETPENRDAQILSQQ
jgi:hypothetical protein